MQQLTLTTPSLLFSAISLILLAYTNRFLSYASVVRALKDKYDQDPENDPTTLAQIRNLVVRLKLIRAMQILGAGSLLFSTVAMFLIYIEWHISAEWVFGIGMVMLALSLCLCIWEIQISVEALSLRLASLKLAKEEADQNKQNKRKFRRRKPNNKPKAKKNPNPIQEENIGSQGFS